MIEAITAALVLIGSVFAWFISPRRKKEKNEAEQKKRSEDFSADVANRNADNIYDDLKRLCDKADRRRLQNRRDKGK